MSCDVGDVTEKLENELCYDVGEAKEGLEKTCVVGEATEVLENEL